MSGGELQFTIIVRLIIICFTVIRCVRIWLKREQKYDD